MVVGIELDARLASIDFFRNDATPGEDIMDFLCTDIGREVGHVDGGVLALTRFGCGFGSFGVSEPATVFLGKRLVVSRM